MKKALQVAFVLVGLGAGGFLIVSQLTKPKPGDDLDFNHYFLCADEQCGEEIAIGPDQWKDEYKLEAELNVPCPKCSTGYAVKAVKCSECGRLHQTVGHGQSQPTCPHCGADLKRKWDE